jgi:hypothetical protein
MYCVWYFWRSDNTLYISDMERYDIRTDKKIYSSHMTKTLVLIIAAIHKECPDVFNNILPPPSVTPPKTAPLSLKVSFYQGVVSLGFVVSSVSWRCLLGCWGWVRYFNYLRLALFICPRYLALVLCSEDILCRYIKSNRAIY